jgi:hypothetical protein
LPFALVKRAVFVVGFGLAILLIYLGIEVGGREYPTQPVLYAAAVIVALSTAAALYRLSHGDKPHERRDPE